MNPLAPARQQDESFAAYKARRRMGQLLVKRHLKGKVVHQAKPHPKGGNRAQRRSRQWDASLS